jgi:hypothetical protein
MTPEEKAVIVHALDALLDEILDQGAEQPFGAHYAVLLAQALEACRLLKGASPAVQGRVSP